jgi:lipopolysaccharide/colanic/teichoic acid biosynthesis glycosyltransferase
MHRIVPAILKKVISSAFAIKPDSRRNIGADTSLQAMPQCARDCQYDHRHLMAESWFTRMLRLERKRTERSRQPFLLLLLDIEVVAASDGGHDRLTHDVLGALTSFARETDIIGWYHYNSVLGVIFTAIGTFADVDKSVNSIVSKVMSALGTQLGQEKSSKIRVSCHVFPDDWTDKTTLGGRPDARLYPDLSQQHSSKWLHNVGKRTIDILGSALAVIILSPLFLLSALSIKLTSKGPVIFRQERVGQFGRPLTLLKFRSMSSGESTKVHEQYVKQLINGSLALPHKGAYKIQHDSRVTPVGRFLRKTSLDELPQFWNVLTGEMSLVGPRPPLPYEVKHYDIWHRRRCLEAKPGITGLWQVTGRSRVCFDDMVRLDLHYAQCCSLRLDLTILLQTPLAVLACEGAH